MGKGQREREGGTESKPASGSELSAQEPDTGLKLRNVEIMT